MPVFEQTVSIAKFITEFFVGLSPSIKCPNNSFLQSSDILKNIRIRGILLCY